MILNAVAMAGVAQLAGDIVLYQQMKKIRMQ
jgi:hypothetical protein